MKEDKAPANQDALYRFHVNIFARSNSRHTAECVPLRNLQLPTVRASRDEFLPVTFEQVLDALASLPRLDAEPDGFFVTSGDIRGKRWQVSGHLFDFNEHLHRVELHGECPPPTFDAILTAIGWPATPLLFELVKEGVALEEPAFRQWTSA